MKWRRHAHTRESFSSRHWKMDVWRQNWGPSSATWMRQEAPRPALARAKDGVLPGALRKWMRGRCLPLQTPSVACLACPWSDFHRPASGSSDRAAGPSGLRRENCRHLPRFPHSAWTRMTSLPLPKRATAAWLEALPLWVRRSTASTAPRRRPCSSTSIVTPSQRFPQVCDVKGISCQHCHMRQSPFQQLLLLQGASHRRSNGAGMRCLLRRPRPADKRHQCPAVHGHVSGCPV